MFLVALVEAVGMAKSNYWDMIYYISYINICVDIYIYIYIYRDSTVYGEFGQIVLFNTHQW